MEGKSTQVALSSGVHDDMRSNESRQHAEPDFWRAVCTNLPEGFAAGRVTANGGNGDSFCLLESNEVFCRQHAIDPNAVNNPAHALYRNPPEWLARCVRSARSMQPISFEHQCTVSERHFELLSYSPLPGRFAIFSRDITVRKKEALTSQAREQFMRDMLSGLPGIVWAASAEGKIEFLSAQWIAYTGTNVTGPGVDWSVLHPDDVDIAMQAWRDAVRNQSAWSLECRFRRHDGQYRWFAWRGTPLYDANGRATHWFGVCTDIDDLKRTQEKLAESERRYTTLFNNRTMAIAHYSILVDEAGKPVDYLVERVNQAYEEIIGIKRDEIEGKRITEIYPDIRDYDFDFIGIFGRVGLHGGEATFEAPLLHPSQRWVSIYAYSPKPGECTALFFDISERKRLEQARRETERRLQLAISIAHLGFWEWEVSSGTCYYSPSWKKQLGYQDTELGNVKEEWERRLHPEDRERVLRDISAYLSRPSSDYRLEYRLRHRDGSYRWMIANAVPLSRRGKDGIKLIGTQLDITENKLAEQRVREAALHDPLTGLPNRALIFEYASHLIAAAKRNHQRGAVLFIDLDRFKPINDLYGHEIGDKLLQEVSRRLSGCVRAEDLVGRLGGDEFVVVLPHADESNPAITVAQHVLETLSASYEIEALDLSISASVGISYFPEHGTDVDALIHAADLAMYQAKQCCHGSAQIFSNTMSTRADAVSTIEARLKRALSHGGLVLHYQPVIDMKSHRLTSVEALLRLTAEDGKLLGPDQFVPIAESAGLIAPLGEWVAAEACRQHEEWIHQGLPPVTIAINVSPLQFRQRGFVTRLTDIILDSTVEPGRIEIEVTESTLMDNMEDAVSILERIRSSGIRIALDDFGTGYSSLSHLSHLPLDKLKVDQSFVRRLEKDRASRAITGAIITLGRTLNLEVVGEGIESEMALDYLQEHGCNHAQGYFISRPLAAPVFAEWYRTRFAGAPASY